MVSVGFAPPPPRVNPVTATGVASLAGFMVTVYAPAASTHTTSDPPGTTAGLHLVLSNQFPDTPLAQWTVQAGFEMT